MEMNTKEFVEEMKKIHMTLLDFLDHDDNDEEKYQNLLNIFDEIKIHDNQIKIKSLFYLILKISDNHNRESNFFSKIEKILQLFKDDMKKYFSNNELFHIFKSNKRLLLFLLEEKMMIMNDFIVNRIVHFDIYIKANYPQYFQPEIQPFIKEKWFPKYEKIDFDDYENFATKYIWVEDINKELPDDFYEKRKIGENDGEICKLVQKDLIKEFIIYVNKNSYPVNSKINPSIYETNNFLLVNESLTLIEISSIFWINSNFQLFETKWC